MRTDESNFETWWRWHLYRRWKNDPGRRSMYAFRRYLANAPADSLAVDCGANVGEITALMLAAGLRVIAFEPDPICIGQLRARFEGEPRLTLIPKAVGASDRHAPLYRQMADGQPATQGSSLIHAEYHVDEPAADVEVVDLMRFLRELGEPVHVLKLDVEGAEAEILEALFDQNDPPMIGRLFAETHESLNPDLARRLGDIRRRVSALDNPKIDLEWG